MVNFDERDLIAMAEDAGFTEIHVHLQADIEPNRPMSWTTLLHSSFNPKIATLAEAMDVALTPAQIIDLTDHLRPQVESGAGRRREAVAYLTAAT